jgi:probable HAF family extracellular repeat protein
MNLASLVQEGLMSAKLSRVRAAAEPVDEPPPSAETNPNDFTRSQMRRSGIPIRLIALFPAVMALGMLACTSEETPTDPTGSPSQAKAAVGTYVGTSLGTLGAPFQCCSEAFDINPAGQIVGRSTTADDVDHAFLWTKGVMTDLGTLGGTTSAATGINPSGQVVGGSATAAGRGHAFLWAKGVMTDLGTLGGNSSTAGSDAAAINPAGQVVGTIENVVGEPEAMLWTRR